MRNTKYSKIRAIINYILVALECELDDFIIYEGKDKIIILADSKIYKKYREFIDINNKLFIEKGVEIIPSDEPEFLSKKYKMVDFTEI